jgi:hypothetical protein
MSHPIALNRFLPTMPTPKVSEHVGSDVVSKRIPDAIDVAFVERRAFA